MKFRRNTIRDKTVFATHKLLYGIKKRWVNFRGKQLEPTTMDNDICSRRFMRIYIDVENREVPKEIQEGEEVLDIGTGTGRLIRIARNRMGKLIGIDKNRRYLELLRERYGEDPKIEFKEADVRRIPLEDRSIEVTVCMGNTLGLFYTMEEKEPKSFQVQALREMVRVTKKRIIITVHSRKMLWESLRYYRMNNLETPRMKNGGVVLREDEELVSQKFSREDLEGLMRAAGIRNYEIIPLNKYVWMVRINSE